METTMKTLKSKYDILIHHAITNTITSGNFLNFPIVLIINGFAKIYPNEIQNKDTGNEFCGLVI